SPPVADAGPDQLGVPAGTKTLNGSRSYDPNGLALTYTWTQDGGPSVAISGANSAVATFNAAAGQSYSFVLTVRNTAGLSASARVRVTTTSPQNAIILFFTANPTNITKGQSSTLSWSTQNATSVTISGIGSVPVSGSHAVSPTQNTVYTLTASNATSSVTATAAVNVGTPTTGGGAPMIITFSANPTTINKGQSSTLSWQVQNATTVTISPTVGNVAENGSQSVSPSSTTTYTLTASNGQGQTATANATVNVNTGPPPSTTITSFTANPPTISSGGSSVLTCNASNATTVTITGAGVSSGATGSSSATTTVTPSATTTYTCTATGAGGTVSQTVTVTVSGGGGG